MQYIFLSLRCLIIKVIRPEKKYQLWKPFSLSFTILEENTFLVNCCKFSILTIIRSIHSHKTDSIFSLLVIANCKSLVRTKWMLTIPEDWQFSKVLWPERSVVWLWFTDLIYLWNYSSVDELIKVFIFSHCVLSVLNTFRFYVHWFKGNQLK